MGRYYYDKKTTVDDCKKIEASWLKRQGYFQGFKSGTITWSRGEEKTGSVGICVDTMPFNDEPPYAKFNYTTTFFNTGEKENFDYKVNLTTTPCNFGGKRWWFVCPIVKSNTPCSRRVDCLYLCSGSKYFACRHCLNLAYSSQNENRRGKWSALGRMMDYENRAENIFKDRRWQTHYAGKPTKKWVKYQRLMEASNVDAGRWLMMQRALKDV